jgi:phage-related protein
MAQHADEPRPLVWRGSSKSDFVRFPAAAHARWAMRCFWPKWANAIPQWRRRSKASAEEQWSRSGKATTAAPCAIYTVRYADAVYVLHAFQKKSKKGIATPKAELDLVERRLKDLIREKERP